MEDFLRAVPQAASNAFALAAYAIAAILFLFAGARLRTTKLLMGKIETIPEAERRRALEIATGTVLPIHISPEQWIRLSRIRWVFLLIGSILIAVLTVTTIAIVNPTKTEIRDIKQTTQTTASETQAKVAAATKQTAEKIDKSTEVIVTSVQDAALANLETMFSLAVRIDRDVDSTIMHLDGRPIQRLISYDNDLKPMRLHWGDRFHYFVYSERGGTLDPDAQGFLEIRGRGAPIRLPLQLDRFAEHELRIPGSSPEPMDAFLINETRTRGIALKITIYSADRERGRAEFRKALMNTTLDSAARRIYFEVQGDGARLRNSPSETSQILRSIQQGSYAKVKARTGDDEWCQIRLPEGREGWMKCGLLKPITASSPQPPSER